MRKPRSSRLIGKTRDSGFQVGVRKTVETEYKQLWKLLISDEGIRIWLGEFEDAFDIFNDTAFKLKDGTTGELRVMSPNSHLRLTWQPPDWPTASTIQVRVIPRDNRTILAFDQEHLPGPDQHETRREFFKNVISKLEKSIKRG